MGLFGGRINTAEEDLAWSFYWLNRSKEEKWDYPSNEYLKEKGITREEWEKELMAGNAI